jgi:hypothetical protein
LVFFFQNPLGGRALNTNIQRLTTTFYKDKEARRRKTAAVGKNKKKKKTFSNLHTLLFDEVVTTKGLRTLLIKATDND